MESPCPDRIPPVRVSTVIGASVERTFLAFTRAMDQWWPAAHTIGSTPIARHVLEERVGGRWLTVQQDGSETVVGHIRVWAPPHRLVFSWDINADWKPDPGTPSEVEVWFEVDGSGTRVTLEHRDFEVLGPVGGADMRDKLANGWPGVLQLFRSHCEHGEAATPQGGAA